MVVTTLKFFQLGIFRRTKLNRVVVIHNYNYSRSGVRDYFGWYLKESLVSKTMNDLIGSNVVCLTGSGYFWPGLRRLNCMR